MAEPTALRFLRALPSSASTSCRSGLRPQSLSPLRAFSQSARVSADAPVDSLLKNVDDNFRRQTTRFDQLIPKRNPLDDEKYFNNLAKSEWEEPERHHLHIYAHKHNTHLTLTKPNMDPLISVSCGNIGFRKAGRGTYDAGYQLAAFLMSRIQDKGLLPQIQRLELIYRGFGPGREAVTKAILGKEGQKIRPLVVRLSDSTRLKFGGTRSKKPRRLG
jgi:small subunit ribosomal protein S11